MIEYEINHCYNFKVRRIAGHRISLEDEDGRSYNVYGYDFQTEWDSASPQVSMGLRCFVKDVEVDGALKLEQCNKDIFKMLYPEAYRNEAKEHIFIVKDLMTKKNGELLFIVSDAFGLTHTYKPLNNQKNMQPGDEIKLTVAGILEKGNNRCGLMFKYDNEKRVTNDYVIETVASDVADEVVIGDFGEETDVLEFKSSIAYPAEAIGCDIDTQMKVIVKTLAGFMNANGGKLLIGVNDNGEAIGIENEYELLNSSQKDSYHYKTDKDGYQSKIRVSIRHYLTNVAEDYVSISFLEHKEKTICSIDIQPSKSVIWFNEREAYKRLGNSTIHLRSASIEKLVLDKMNLQRPEAYFIQPTLVDDEKAELSENIGESYDICDSDVMEKTTPVSLNNIGELRTGKGSFYMNIFSNGQWSWSCDIPTDSDLEFCIPINSPASKNSLMLVYDDGCVNRVDAYHLHLNKSEGKRYENGCRNDGVKLVKAFHAKKDDLIACFSVKDGHEFVKVHMVSDVSEHDLMSLKGNRLINKTGISGITEANICFVSSVHKQRVSALIKSENQKSNSLGFQMDIKRNSHLHFVRETLISVCDVLADHE